MARGLQVIEDNPMGFCAVRLHYTADPEKDPGSLDPGLAEKARVWLEAQRRQWTDPNEFSREFEINFHVGKGTRVFPQFTELTHAPTALTYTRRRVLYRSWDFGWHAPVCLISQIDNKERLLGLQEVVGAQIDTRIFAEDVIDRCAEWYPQHAAGYQDFCDPAGQQVRDIASERGEKREIEILNGLGIYPTYEYGWSRKDGRALVHQLLTLRTDGTPGLYLDPTGCPTVLRAFLGGYVYKDKKDGTVQEDPDDDTHPWADVMAAMRYLATGLRAKLGLHRLITQYDGSNNGGLLPVTYQGYGTPKRENEWRTTKR